MAKHEMVSIAEILSKRYVTVNFTPMFPVISLLCFHPFHKHVSTYFTRSFHLETVRETNRSFPLAV
jgi:hypothetical protein